MHKLSLPQTIVDRGLYNDRIVVIRVFGPRVLNAHHEGLTIHARYGRLDLRIALVGGGCCEGVRSLLRVFDDLKPPLGDHGPSWVMLILKDQPDLVLLCQLVCWFGDVVITVSLQILQALLSECRLQLG